MDSRPEGTPGTPLIYFFPGCWVIQKEILPSRLLGNFATSTRPPSLSLARHAALNFTLPEILLTPIRFAIHPLHRLNRSYHSPSNFPTGGSAGLPGRFASCRRAGPPSYDPPVPEVVKAVACFLTTQYIALGSAPGDTSLLQPFRAP